MFPCGVVQNTVKVKGKKVKVQHSSVR